MNNSNAMERLDYARNENINSINLCSFPLGGIESRAVSYDDVLQEIKSRSRLWSRSQKQCSSQSKAQSCDSVLTVSQRTCDKTNSMEKFSSQLKESESFELCQSKSNTKNSVDTDTEQSRTKKCSKKNTPQSTKSNPMKKGSTFDKNSVDSCTKDNNIQKCSSRQKAESTKICHFKLSTSNGNSVYRDSNGDNTNKCSSPLKTPVRFEEYESGNKENEQPIRTAFSACGVHPGRSWNSVRSGGSQDGITSVRGGGSYESVISARGFKPPKVDKSALWEVATSKSVKSEKCANNDYKKEPDDPKQGKCDYSEETNSDTETGVNFKGSERNQDVRIKVNGWSDITSKSDVRIHQASEGRDCATFVQHEKLPSTCLDMFRAPSVGVNLPDTNCCPKSEKHSKKLPASSLEKFQATSLGVNSIKPETPFIEPSLDDESESKGDLVKLHSSRPPIPPSKGSPARHRGSSPAGTPGSPSARYRETSLMPLGCSSSSSTPKPSRASPSPLRASRLKLWQKDNNTSPADQSLNAQDFF